MSCLQDNLGRAIGFEGLKPAVETEAPAVSGDEAGELVFGAGGDEVVALCLAKFEKVVRHDCADGVHASVGSGGVAATVAEEAGHGAGGAGGEGGS